MTQTVTFSRSAAGLTIILSEHQMVAAAASFLAYDCLLASFLASTVSQWLAFIEAQQNTKRWVPCNTWIHAHAHGHGLQDNNPPSRPYQSTTPSASLVTAHFILTHRIEQAGSLCHQ